MKRFVCYLLCLGMISTQLFAEEAKPKAITESEETDDVAYLGQRRQDQIPLEVRSRLKDSSYLEAYIQALVDMHYFDYRVLVKAKGHTIELYNLPKNELTASSIVSFVQDFPGVEKVEVVREAQLDEKDKRYSAKEAEAFPDQENHLKGVWMPQQTVLFAPLIADPREVSYSIGYRFHDTALGSKIVPVSFGDTFPIYRWIDVGPFHGDLELSIVAGVWAVFTLDDDINSLMNADYTFSFPLTYAFGRWSHRLRFMHLSSHLGDEYMVTHPTVTRLNVSYETVDLTSSYQLNESCRLYAGAGAIVHYDKKFPMKRLYLNYGTEVRMLGVKDLFHRLYWEPFFAVNFANWQLHSWDFDQTYAMGIEWSKLRGVGRKVRVYVEAHDGFSREGQFQELRSRYVALKFAYGF